MERIEIQLKKSMYIRTVILFIFFGLLFSFLLIGFIILLISSPFWYVMIVGGLVYAFLVLLSVYLLIMYRLYFRIKRLWNFVFLLALTLDNHGVQDNSAGYNLMQIKWEDIVNLKVELPQFGIFTKFDRYVLLIFIKNNDFYLGQSKSVRIKLMKKNLKNYGTPFAVYCDNLDYDSNALVLLLNKKLKENQVEMKGQEDSLDTSFT